MSLSVALRHRLGAFALDAAFEAPAGVTALFGRSGAGKSTLVAAVAGLLRPEAGRIVVDGETLLDTRRGVFVPAHRRRVGCVFQEGRLFPHLSVRANLLFGRRFAPRRAAGPGLDEVTALLGIAPLLARRPGELSGGERQRVAIGRALLAKPRILLMDEPLASLDAARKAEILPYLERLRDEARTPILYVSHSAEEVARLATTVALMAEGRVLRVGPAREVLSDLAAAPALGPEEAGAVLAARIEAQDAADEITTLAVSGGRLHLPRIDGEPGARLRVRVRARDVMVATLRPEGLSALNVLPATVTEVAPAEGGVARLRLRVGDDFLLARVTRRSAERLGLAPGREVFAVLKAVSVARADLGFEEAGGLEG